MSPAAQAVLTSRKQTESAVRYFIDRAVQTYAEEGAPNGAVEVFSYWLNTFYPVAVANVYRFSDSPIETTFLNGLILSFLIEDPMGLFITAPHADVLKSLKDYCRPLRRMLQIDSEMRNPPSEKNSFLKRIEEQVLAGSVSARKAQRLRMSYVGNHGLGMWNAFYVAPQAGFPSIKVSGHSIRTDLFVCIPAAPSLRFVVECDGYQYHSSRTSFTNDRRRDRLLQEHGLLVRRYAGSEI